MASPISNKVFVITGGGSGVGLATASTLLARGAMIGLCDVNESGLTTFAGKLSETEKIRLFARPVDITDRSALRTFLQQTKEKFGRLDGVANIAGTPGRNIGHHEIWEVEEDEYDFVMAVNVRGIFNVLSEALRPGVIQEPGSIVHTTSMYAERGFPKGSIYSASKHAGVGIIKSAAMEAAKRRIRVNGVSP